MQIKFTTESKDTEAWRKKAQAWEMIAQREMAKLTELEDRFNDLATAIEIQETVLDQLSKDVELIAANASLAYPIMTVNDWDQRGKGRG